MSVAGDPLCQVLATWRTHYPADYWQPSTESFHADRQSSSWSPPPIPERLDDETEAALLAWQHDGLPRVFASDGIAWPSRVALRIDHRGEPLGELQVDRVGDLFTAIGEIPELAAAKLAGYQYVSDTLYARRARVVEVTPGTRFVEVVESEIVELSATHAPAAQETALMVGRPGASWLPPSTVARFAYHDESLGLRRFTAAGNV